MRGSARLAAIAMLAAGVPAGAQQFVSESFAFLKAVRDRDGTKVQEALDAPGSSIARSRDRETGETGLHIVTRRRDLVYLQVLAGRGAPVDGRDNNGLTALALAAQIGWTEGAQALIGYGATVDLADGRGETPLILATQTHNAGVARLLVANGADPRKPDGVAGMSALDYATRDGRSPELVRLFQETKPVVRKRVSGPSIGG